MTASLLNGLTAVVEIIMNMIQFLVLASVLISWVGADPSNALVRMVRDLTEPMYRPFRKLTKNLPGAIDWAPFCILLILVFIQRGIFPYLRMLAIQSMGGFPQ